MAIFGAMMFGLPSASLIWVGVLLCMWSPFLLEFSGASWMGGVSATFVGVNLIGAIAALAQFATQLLGGQFVDPMNQLPSEWLVDS